MEDIIDEINRTEIISLYNSPLYDSLNEFDKGDIFEKVIKQNYCLMMIY